MSEGFFNWICRKYGFGKSQFAQIEQDDPAFANSLVREYSSVSASYGGGQT